MVRVFKDTAVDSYVLLDVRIKLAMDCANAFL